MWVILVPRYALTHVFGMMMIEHLSIMEDTSPSLPLHYPGEGNHENRRFVSRSARLYVYAFYEGEYFQWSVSVGTRSHSAAWCRKPPQWARTALTSLCWSWCLTFRHNAGGGGRETASKFWWDFASHRHTLPAAAMSHERGIHRKFRNLTNRVGLFLPGDMQHNTRSRVLLLFIGHTASEFTSGVV